MDCSPFLNRNEEELESEHEKAVVFLSLVATLKLQPALDDSLEAQAVELHKYMIPKTTASADAFLNSFGRAPDESSTNFIQSIGILISSPSQTITTTAMGILISQILSCSAERKLHLVKADLIHQLIIILNPQSLSFTEAVDIHINLMKTIRLSLRLATPDILEDLGIEDGYEEQAVHEIVLKQVLAPSEKYICHLCMNHFSIIDPDLFHKLREWNEHGRDLRQMWKMVLRMLRMEGFSDVMEEKLRNDETEALGG
ncbi:hypothetical protein BLNAU_7131 [Blattamonas nauphoetae]|uniref:Uncharacterized protein n=1 Tax=Blattamonas nauphoetae TaxID=2049346 RepID=A0ABQ9Y2J9_9EUKA|nr:hypothetical protein BLNAU_7131 [Blattamonas nauphoetae]